MAYGIKDDTPDGNPPAQREGPRPPQRGSANASGPLLTRTRGLESAAAAGATLLLRVVLASSSRRRSIVRRRCTGSPVSFRAPRAARDGRMRAGGAAQAEGGALGERHPFPMYSLPVENLREVEPRRPISPAFASDERSAGHLNGSRATPTRATAASERAAPDRPRALLRSRDRGAPPARRRACASCGPPGLRAALYIVAAGSEEAYVRGHPGISPSIWPWISMVLWRAARTCR